MKDCELIKSKGNLIDMGILIVFTITLIASIESLLSIKAVDKLDPKKRRSNVKKDLKALGLATIISGFLGGLNVVTDIARSSVHVTNNASNRSANFFHGVFLILFVLLFQKQLQFLHDEQLLQTIADHGTNSTSNIQQKIQTELKLYIVTDFFFPTFRCFHSDFLFSNFHHFDSHLTCDKPD